jgi:hypothetical protein
MKLLVEAQSETDARVQSLPQIIKINILLVLYLLCFDFSLSEVSLVAISLFCVSSPCSVCHRVPFASALARLARAFRFFLPVVCQILVLVVLYIGALESGPAKCLTVRKLAVAGGQRKK